MVDGSRLVSLFHVGNIKRAVNLCGQIVLNFRREKCDLQ